MIGLLVVSLVACIMVGARMLYTRTGVYDFLIWNLFLAWVPLMFALWRCKTTNLWGRRALALGWLAFYPNAPYIVTDLKHIRWAVNAAWWYDMALVFLFALLGMRVGLRSLELLQAEVAERKGKTAGWVFASVVCFLAGVGVYIGRFQRWNSWDIVRDPVGLVIDTLRLFMNLEVLPRLLGVSVLYAALQLLCYLTISHVESPSGSKA
jgi:uncharacterized membrane protein